MKKFFCLLGCLLLLCFTSCKNLNTMINADNESMDYDSMFGNAIKSILAEYNHGKYGDEVYYLASGGWGGRSDIAIYKTGNDTQIVFYQESNRCKTRQMTEDEIRAFDSFIAENKIDALTDWDTYMVMDGTGYQYMHFSQNNQVTFYMNNPEIFVDLQGFEGQEIYDSLVKKFFDLTEVGKFDVYYDLGKSSKDVNVLIQNEDYFVESVWKDGNDFRVLIKDVENSDYKHKRLDWFKFENGVIGAKVDEPDGITLQNAWADIPDTEMVWSGDSGSLGGFEFQEHLNNYPWQTRWQSYFVRSLRNYDSMTSGLWLTKQGEEPKLILEGTYGHPIVIPDTDWVVCLKADGGWANPRYVVKIDLNTFEEIIIDLPPADWMEPIVFFNNKLIILRNENYYSSNTGSLAEYFMYDVASNALEKAKVDFSCLSRIKGRFLQKTKTNNYFALEDQHTIGILDANSYKFKKLASFDVLIYNNDNMWVDEDEGVIYIVVNGDLLELPLEIK